jgi:AraC family transcriptional regulator
MKRDSQVKLLDFRQESIFCTLKDELLLDQIGGSLLIDSLQTTLAIHLLRQYCTTTPKLSSYENGLSKLKLKEITEYIDANLDCSLKIIQLAAIAKLSPYHFTSPTLTEESYSHFAKYLKRFTGLTPKQLQTRSQ